MVESDEGGDQSRSGGSLCPPETRLSPINPESCGTVSAWWARVPPATSPSPCWRRSTAFGPSPQPSHQTPSMRRSPTQASRMACPRPVVHLLGSIESWKAATRRASRGADPLTGEADARIPSGGGTWEPPTRSVAGLGEMHGVVEAGQSRGAPGWLSLSSDFGSGHGL